MKNQLRRIAARPGNGQASWGGRNDSNRRDLHQSSLRAGAEFRHSTNLYEQVQLRRARPQLGFKRLAFEQPVARPNPRHTFPNLFRVGAAQKG